MSRYDAVEKWLAETKVREEALMVMLAQVDELKDFIARWDINDPDLLPANRVAMVNAVRHYIAMAERQREKLHPFTQNILG